MIVHIDGPEETHMIKELSDEELDNVIGGQPSRQFEAYRAKLINEYNINIKDYGNQEPRRTGTRVPILPERRRPYYLRKLQLYILYLLRRV